MDKPFAQSYWAVPGLLCAGHYPGAEDTDEHREKLGGLVRCGIRRVINLIPDYETGRGGRPFRAYMADLAQLSAAQGVAVECARMGWPDGTTPDRAHMQAILDRIDQSVAAQEPVYVHCWGGHGRTGTTVGCFLVRHGATPEAAIAQILAWREPLPRNHFPFEGQQEAFVREWRAGQ